MNMKHIDWSNPGVVIGLVVALLVGVELISIAFPKLIAGLTGLSTINGFAFSDFFADGGIVSLVLSALVLIGVLIMLGVKMTKGKR